MKKKDVLFLTTQLPYPPISGGTIKTYHLLKHLSNKYRLSFACLLKNDDLTHEGEFKKKVKTTQYFSTRVNVQRNTFNLLKSYLLSKSFNSFRNRNKVFKSKVSDLAQGVDAIIVDHYEMFQYVPDEFAGKVVFHTHNAEFLLWERMSSLEGNIFKKAVLFAESLRVKNLERRIIQRSDVVFATPHDISVFQRVGIKSLNLATTYHLGDDQLLKGKAIQFSDTEKSLIFVGTLSWEPNVHGLIWFIKYVLPTLREIHPDILVYIIGGGKLDKRLEKYTSVDNVVFTGFVESIEAYYEKARVSIIPLQFGSGMKVKVLESMYRGIPMVTTSVGAEGIQIQEGKDAFIDDTVNGFTQKISTLMENEKTWTKFRDRSRKIAQENYTWEKLFHHMDKVMDRVIE